MSKVPEQQPPDAELLRRLRMDQRGEEGRQAASLLLERYQDRVYLWCLRLMRDHEHALELAQEVMVRAYKGMAGFEGRSSFSSWLFMVTRNRCLAELRRPTLLRDEEADPDELPGSAPTPDRALEEEMDETELLRLIRHELQPIEQEVLWMRCIEKMPVTEITTLLGIEAASGARGVLQTARRKLRAAMARSAGAPLRPYPEGTR